MSGTFDEKLTDIERALKIISTIENNPELQNRTFDLLFGDTTLRAPEPRRTRETPASSDSHGGPDGSASSTTDSGDGGAKSRIAKKSGKVSIAQDKSLDTAPSGVQSWKAFAAEKGPTSIRDKNVVAVYWLLEIAGHDKATINKVYTLFLDAGWRPPTDPRNAAQQAGSKGYLDTVDAEDIKVTPRGIGLVKNDLPNANKK